MQFVKDYIDLVIVAILLIMGFISIMCTIERLIYLNKVNVEDFKDKDSLEVALTNNLTPIYIIYSNAPYVGLLGTVIGIMITFYDMSQNSSIDTQSIMQGLSLALHATALGLIIAIPSLISYNALNRKIVKVQTIYKGSYE